MKKIILCAGVIFLCGAAVSAKNVLVKDSQPASGGWKFDCLQKINAAPAEKREYDVRSCDLSAADLSGWKEDVLDTLSFDDKTVWPQKMPPWLRPGEIMSAGKTPGLNIRSLHKAGITGKGVNIAIIDQSLPEHSEYRDNLVFYKDMGWPGPSMHGPAVASIAVGKTVGAAPGASLYYISAEFNQKDGVFDAGSVTAAIKEIISLNKKLPQEKRVNVISISRGFDDLDKGRKEFLSVVEKAKKQNILVLTTNDVFTLSRTGYYADPDDIISYKQPAYWFKKESLGFYNSAEDIIVPTDYRITASLTGENDFAAYAQGGLSWAVPYLAGVYALAKQADPELTPDGFMRLAKETADSVSFEAGGQKYTAKYFINPAALINKLRR